MGKILLDFVFPISVIPTIPAASTAYLKQACVVAKPKAGQEGNVGTVYQCATMAAVAARTDNENAEQLFNAGMTKVYILLANNLDLAEALVSQVGNFFTVLVSDDFDDSDFDGEGGTPAVAASLVVGDLTFEAKTPGVGGNSITVALVIGETGDVATAHATGNDIVVTIDDGVTKAETIKAAIEESVSASALVTATVAEGEETSVQAIAAEAPLTGGAAAVTAAAVKASLEVGDLTFEAVEAGADGNTITIALVDGASAGAATALATGTDVVITIDDGVTTAQTIKDALEESVSASALLTVTIAGGQAAVAQDAAAEAPLEDGADALGLQIDVGAFDGVVGVSSSDTAVCAAMAAVGNRVAFFRKEANGAKNMFYAFGKLLGNLLNWTNQQYIGMPFSDDVETLGDANSLFDSKVSFVIEDDEFGNKLSLFAVGGKAIVAPYIEKNLRVDLQSATVSWIAANQPAYTKVNASLLETRLNEDVIKGKYINPPLAWIEAGLIEVELIEDNFVASGFINIAEPKALWRMFGEMRATL